MKQIVAQIHDQMDQNPHYPFNLQSAWLPHPNSAAICKFYEWVQNAPDEPYAPSVEALDQLIQEDPTLMYLIHNACKENENLLASQQQTAEEEQVCIPKITSKNDLLSGFNRILTMAPQFFDDALVGLPFSALVVGIDPTLSGVTLFGLPKFNHAMKKVLDDWNVFLASEDSNTGFREEGKQWLSTTAKNQYEFEVWKKDNETLPYWNSWNSFFTREFKNPEQSRPIAAPDSNQIAISANDGSLFRWDDNISRKDVFWFKDMEYSLADIFSSDIPDQQQVMDEHKLVDLFTHGVIFQTYLNPYNFHRWWCPVNGTIVFDPIDIPGAFFNKLVIPDFAGATTASLPYLVQVNARGLIVFKTEDFGYVCCIPLGMSEVSSVVFDESMKQGATVTKGQEMGKFEYGGSSFVMIFQKIPGQRLIFQNATGEVYEKRPVLPTSSAGTGGNITLIGSQIGKWESVDYNVHAGSGWMNTGYVNDGKSYKIQYIGGLWTANPANNDGNLYGPDGSDVTATQSCYPLVGANEGALIGKVGDYDPFLIGQGATIPAGQTGPLKLCINDDLHGDCGAGLKDNVGTIVVSIDPV